MKFTTLKAFEKHLKGSSPQHFSPVYLIISKDSFMRKTAVECAVKAISDAKSLSEVSIKRFNDGKYPIEDIIAELNTFTLFSNQRIICVDIPEKMAAALLKPLQEYFANPTRMTYLMISTPSINQTTNFYKQAEKIGIVLEMAEEKSWEKEKSLADWIATKVASEGKSIEPKGCQHLVKQVGTDFAILQREIDKLLCYIGDRAHITLADIGAICANVSTENAWQLGEALFRRDTATALNISLSLLDEGTPFLSLLRQLRHQIQTDYTVCSILANQGGKEEIMQKFPYMKGFILDRHMRSAQEYGMARFRNAMLEIDATELVAKNSSFDQNLLAELLMIKLTK